MTIMNEGETEVMMQGDLRTDETDATLDFATFHAKSHF